MKYKEFVSQEFKKRPKTMKVTEYMKKVASKWKKKQMKGGALDVDETKQELLPRVETIEPLKAPTNTPQPPQPIPKKVEYLPPALPTQPKGVWCFFHSEDLSPIDLHGGNILKKLKRKILKITDKVKEGVKLIKPLKRGMTDYPLASISATEKPVPYITLGKEKRADGEYDVATISFYYKDNPAIALGWQVRPKDKNLGYHIDDLEFVSIYYQNGNPIKVFMSEHSVGGGEGQWRNYKDCEFKDGYLVVYVARNSHANYFTAGTHTRVYGVANDVTEKTGPNKAYPFSEMTPSYNWNNGKGIRLMKGLRPAPPDKSMSQRERILRF